MVDVQDSYGYSRPLLAQSLAGARASAPASMLVGLCGLRSNALELGKTQYWCRRLI